MQRIVFILCVPLSACVSDAAPPACVAMCEAAAALYGDCLTDWGADWSAAGYADEEDFLGACETWGWEMSLLEADAVDRGTEAARGSVARTCRSRRAAFADPDASCDAYTGTDWNARPWDDTAEDDTGGT
ncbi:MAG: hypothetical protein VX265_07295 [Myxococcota bacterium]|nr:hypothetical protein [Myxococcota bacterium]